MIAAARAALAALALAGAPQDPAPRPAPPPAPPAPAPETSPAATIAEWRELLELDLAQPLIDEGVARVSAGGDLAEQGEAVALVARALFEHGREAEAFELLDAARPSEATRVFVDLERARAWIEDDELDRALTFLLPDRDAAAPRAAERPESWLFVGRAWMRRGEPARATPFLERFVTLAPLHDEAPAALHMLAQAALRAGDGARATAWSRRAQELGRWHAYLRVRRLQVREQPAEPLPRLGLAQLWLQAGDLDRAEVELRRLFAIAPDYPAGWFQMGEVLRKRGDLAGAARAFDRALAGDPELFVARHNRAVIALGEGRLDDARRDLELLADGAHADDPRILGAHLLLARLLAAAGEEAAAAERYARYRELGGDEPLAP